MLLLGGLATVAILVIVSSGAVNTARSNPTPAAEPDATSLDAFGILRRPRVSQDTPSSYVAAFHAPVGASMDLIRRAEGFAGGEAYLVPGNGVDCLIAESTAKPNGGAVCDEAGYAASGKMALTASNPEVPGVVLVAGLVPDGTTSVTAHLQGGGAQTLPVHENVYMAEIEGSLKSVTTSGSQPVEVDVKETAPK